MHWNWRLIIIWIMKVNLFFWIADLLLLPFLSFFLGVDMLTLMLSGYFSTMLFVDSGIIFLIGGLIAFSSSIFPSKIREHFFHSRENWSLEKQKQSEAKANLYILSGIILLLESMILALNAF